MKRKIILIYHYTRCGSTALCNAFKSGESYILGEILNKNTHYGEHYHALHKEENFMFKEDFKNFLDNNYVEKGKTIFLEITTFDLFVLINLNLSDLIKDLIKISDLSVVHLYRDNLLNRHISSEMANQSQIWHSTEAKKQQLLLNFNIDKAIIDIYANSLAFMKTKLLLRNLNINYLEICYENILVNGVASESNKIINNFNIQGITAKVPDEVQMGRYSERISNWDEIFKKIEKNIELSPYLKDSANKFIY